MLARVLASVTSTSLKVLGSKAYSLHSSVPAGYRLQKVFSQGAQNQRLPATAVQPVQQR